MWVKLWAHNITGSEAADFSPFSVLYGQVSRLLMDVTLADKELKEEDHSKIVDQFVEERQERMKVMSDLITARVEAGQQRLAKRYDSTRRKPDFSLGELVWVRNHNQEKGRVNKSHAKYNGPWKISERVFPVTYKVVNSKGKNNNIKTMNVSIMKKCHSREPEVEKEFKELLHLEKESPDASAVKSTVEDNNSVHSEASSKQS